MDKQLTVLAGNELTNGSLLEMHVRYLECIFDSDANVGHVDILHGDFALKIDGWTK